MMKDNPVAAHTTPHTKSKSMIVDIFSPNQKTNINKLCPKRVPGWSFWGVEPGGGVDGASFIEK